MTRYEYKVVPAPKRGEKVRGARHVEDRFAHALSTIMNEFGSDGWEYLRSDTLPCEERVGLTGRTTTFQNMLVFRRVIPSEPARSAPMATATVAEPEAPATVVAPVRRPEPLSEAAAAGLAKIATIDRPSRGDGPRLVMTSGEGGNTPPLGSARGKGLTAHGDSGDNAAD